MRGMAGTTNASRRLRTFGMLAVVAMVAACTPFGGSGAKHPATTVSVTAKNSSHPKVHIVRKYRTLHIGQVAQLGTAGSGAAELIKIGKPHVARGPLSRQYGYAPQHGYYVNFPIKIYDDGKDLLPVNRLDFWVIVPGQGTVNTNQGNSPVSGAHEQLDTTEIGRASCRERV